MNIVEYSSNILDDIKFIEITNNNGSRLKLMNLGATIVEICVPDKYGNIENVVLTLEDEVKYLTDLCYFGATIGRTSGRIKNGEFKIDGIKYKLHQNIGGFQLHGGVKGYSFQYFDYKIIVNNDEAIVDYIYHSHDMEEGYPGNVNLIVRYTFTDDDILTINYIAKSDKKTIMNFTNHSYFNLTGNCRDNITNHKLKINSNKYLETDADLVPTGIKLDVTNTPLDFNHSKRIGRDIELLYQCKENGYDHVLLFSDEKIITLQCVESGRNLEVTTSYPAVVMYSLNYPSNNLLTNNKKQSKHLGLAIECQYEPNGINTSSLSNALYDTNELYNHFIKYKFTVNM